MLKEIRTKKLVITGNDNKDKILAYRKHQQLLSKGWTVKSSGEYQKEVIIRK